MARPLRESVAAFLLAYDSLVSPEVRHLHKAQRQQQKDLGRFQQYIDQMGTFAGQWLSGNDGQGAFVQYRQQPKPL